VAFRTVKAFARAFGSLTLRPGEARVYREQWDQRDVEGRLVSPGWYTVAGLFPPERAFALNRPYTPRPRVMIRIARIMPGGWSGGPKS